MLIFSSFGSFQKKIEAEENAQNNGSAERLEDVTNVLNPIDLETEKKSYSDNNFSITKESNNSQYKMSSYENQVQKDTEDKKWSQIDTTLKQHDDENIKPVSTEIDVAFDKTIKSNDEIMTVNDSSDNKVSFSFKGIIKDKEIMSPNTVNAQLNKNSITYKNIFLNIDLRNIVLNQEVKEDVILDQNFERFDSFVYQIHTDLKAILNKDGEIQFFNPQNEVVYTMAAPLMSDSKIDDKSGISAVSEKIEYTLSKKDDGYELQLIPDLEWINDKDRVYPIYLDPSISKDTSTDTFVSSAEPSKNFNKFWSSALGEYVLRVGKYDSATGTNYSLIKLSNLSDLKGATITNAFLKTFVRWSYYDGVKTGLWIDYLNSDWNDSKLTWSTKPSSTKIASTTVSRNQWATFDVTSAIKTIANGSREDFGFKFHANANGQTYWKQLSASENSSNKTKIDVTYSYPKMSSLKNEVYPSAAGSETGYVNLSWAPAKFAEKYRLQLYNGKGWRTIYSGTSLKYSTKDKKIWPKPSQYKDKDSLTGGIAFRQNDGMELPMDPSDMYSASAGTKISTKSYQFRVVADYPLGSSPVSSIFKPVLDGMIPDKPDTISVAEVFSNEQDEKGYFKVKWDEVEGATSYDLMIFNGNNYERIPVGNVTEWTSKGKKLFPTEQQLKLNTAGNTKLFRVQKDGRDFLTDSRALYKNNGPGTSYHKITNYYVKLVAKSSKGESLPSDFTRVYFPVKEVYSDINYKLISPSEGNIKLNWNNSTEAAGYLIYMYNGKEYQLVDDVGASINTWSTENKLLWPKSQQGYLLRHKTKDGVNLPIKPSTIYDLNNDVLSLNNRYSFKILPYRFIDSSFERFDMSRYKGIYNEDEIKSLSIELPNNATKTLATPQNVNVNDTYLTDKTGSFEISWNSVENAEGYIVSIFNGKIFEEFDVGSNTEWSTKDKKIFPTENELSKGEYKFHKDNLGRDFERYPEKLYLNAKNESDENYLFKVRAYNKTEISNDTDVVEGYISQSDKEWLNEAKASDKVNESYIDEEAGLVSGEKLYDCDQADSLSECNLMNFKDNLKEQQEVIDEISELGGTEPKQLDEVYSEELNTLESNVATENLQDKLAEMNEEQNLEILNESLSEEELLQMQAEEESYEDDGADKNEEEIMNVSSYNEDQNEEVETNIVNDNQEIDPNEATLESASVQVMYDTQNGSLVTSNDYLQELKEKVQTSQRSISTMSLRVGGLLISTLQKEYKSYKGKKFALLYDFSVERTYNVNAQPSSYKVTRYFLGKTKINDDYKETASKKTTTGVKGKGVFTFPTQLQDKFTLNSVKFRKVVYKIEPQGKIYEKYLPVKKEIPRHLYNMNGMKYPLYKDKVSNKTMSFPNSTTYKTISSSAIATKRKKWDSYRDTYRRAYEKSYGSSPKGGGKRGNAEAWSGYPVHHIRPLQFDGPPTSKENLIPMTTKAHQNVHRFWSGYLKQTKKP